MEQLRDCPNENCPGLVCGLQVSVGCGCKFEKRSVGRTLEHLEYFVELNQVKMASESKRKWIRLGKFQANNNGDLHINFIIKHAVFGVVSNIIESIQRYDIRVRVRVRSQSRIRIRISSRIAIFSC